MKKTGMHDDRSPQLATSGKNRLKAAWTLPMRQAPSTGPLRTFSIRIGFLVAMLIWSSACPVHAQANGGSLAVIEDRDGFSNIRSRASRSGTIVARVMDDEPFTVFVDGGQWWRVRTKKGVAGYIHRSCVRLLQETASEPAKATPEISRDPATLAAWTFYMSTQEEGRSHTRNGGKDYTGEWIISKFEPMNLAGVDPTVAGFLKDVVTQTRWEMEVTRQVMGSVRGVAPAITLRDALRPFGGQLGRKLMPDSPDLGSVLGQVLVYYAFSDAVVPEGLPAEHTMYALLKAHDQMLVMEGLINTALALEQPEGLRILLNHVQRHAYSSRLQSGRWIFTDVDGGEGTLAFKQDPKSAYHAGGWVSLRWRNRQISEKYFQYEFSDDGLLRLKDTSLFGEIAGPFAFKKAFRVQFTRPTVLKLTELSGDPRGTWEQVSRATTER